MQLGREEVLDSASQLNEQMAAAIDSIELSQQENILVILAQGNDYRLHYDSLQDVLDSITHEADRLSAKLAQLESQKKNSAKTDNDKKIGDFYTSLMKKLPSDLTDYEREVAIREIENRTKKEFSLSPTELTRIKKKYGLADR
jgi:hypothetical protein